MKDPAIAGIITIKNGGVIQTEEGTAIISVDENGNATVVAVIQGEAGSIGTAELADLAVTAGKIASDAVTTAKILDSNVTAGKLAATLDISAKAVTFPPLLSSVAGLVGTFKPMLVQQALTGAGVVNLTTYYTTLTNNGANAVTLADATIKGHLKKVQMIVDPGTDSTLTFNTNATIVFADVGDYAILMWNGSDWIPIELGNDADGATAPVYTPAS